MTEICDSGAMQKLAEAEQLLKEQKEYELELERKEKMREEAERLAEIEAERKKVRTFHLFTPS